MRVLMISDFYHPFVGGVEQHVRSLSQALVAAGHDVAVATLGSPTLPEVDRDGDVRIYRLRGSAQRTERLFASAARPWAPPFADPELTFGLRRIVAQEQPDIVHGHDWLTRSFLPLKHWSRAKLIASLHYYTLSCAKKNLLYQDAPCVGPAFLKCAGCAAAHYGTAKGQAVLAASLVGGAWERRAVDMFIAVSQATAEGNGLRADDPRCRVIPNFLPAGVAPNPERVAPYLEQLPAGDFLLFVGDLRHAKGLDVLLDAYVGLRDAPPLVLIGKVWPETPSSFPPNVIILKDWPNEAVLAAWRRATVGVVPSIWPEPFGIVVIEAMAGGCPVVASRLGGIPDIVVDGETGILVPPADPRALRGALERLLGDRALLEGMGQAGKRRAGLFEADAVVPRIARVYQEALGAVSPRVAPPVEATAGTSPPLVSIVINNYNYGRFLGQAIDSAVGQTYERTEIVVVDDGSTDDSRDVIAGYGNRVIPVLKENGGQASAFNAGFARSRGDVVIFLDSDDMLLPHTAAAVAQVFQEEPGTAKIQYRLDMIDAEGNPLGRQTPPATLPLPDGDLRRQMLRFPDDVRTPPTSGNAFAASTLRQILPMPEEVYGSTGADLYLYNLAPLYGQVKSLPDPGGSYRVHGNNHYYSDELSSSQLHTVIVRSLANHQYLIHHAHGLQLQGVPRSGAEILSVTYLVNRIASFKLDRARHPVSGDTTFKLAWLGILAAARRFDVPLHTRILYMLWFVAAAGAPKRLIRWLVTNAFHVERRGALGRLV